MTLKLYTEENIQNIADAIRTKNQKTDTYKVDEMADAILEIPSGKGTWEWTRPAGWPDLDALEAATKEDHECYYLGTWVFDDIAAEDNIISFHSYIEEVVHIEIGYMDDAVFVSLYENNYNTYNRSVPINVNDVIGEEDRRLIYAVRVTPYNLPWKKCIYLGCTVGTYETTRQANRVGEVIAKLPNIKMSSGSYSICGNSTERLKLIGAELINSTLYHSAYSGLQQIEFVDCNFGNITTYNPGSSSYGSFGKCDRVKRIVSNTPIVTAAVTSTAYMFKDCRSLLSLDCTGWDFSNVTAANTMFSACNALQEVKGLQFSNKLTTLANAFTNCVSLKELDLSTSDLSGLTTLSKAFSYSTNLKKLVFPSTLGASLTSMANMIEYNSCSLKTLDLSIIDGSHITSSGFTAFIQNSYGLNYLNIPSNMSQVTSISVSSTASLTLQSILDIMNTLVDHSGESSGTVYRLTLGSHYLAKLTDEQKFIATGKGWQLS